MKSNKYMNCDKYINLMPIYCRSCCFQLSGCHSLLEGKRQQKTEQEDIGKWQGDTENIFCVLLPFSNVPLLHFLLSLAFEKAVTTSWSKTARCTKTVHETRLGIINPQSQLLGLELDLSFSWVFQVLPKTKTFLRSFGPKPKTPKT